MVAVGDLLLECAASGGQLGIDIAGCIETEVPHLDKGSWQDVKEKSLNEFDGRKLAGLVVAGSEYDMLVVDVENSVIGDGDPVGVQAEVAKEGVGSFERSFGEDDPILAIEVVFQAGKGRKRKQLDNSRWRTRRDGKLALIEESGEAVPSRHRSYILMVEALAPRSW